MINPIIPPIKASNSIRHSTSTTLSNRSRSSKHRTVRVIGDLGNRWRGGRRRVLLRRWGVEVLLGMTWGLRCVLLLLLAGILLRFLGWGWVVSTLGLGGWWGALVAGHCGEVLRIEDWGFRGSVQRFRGSEAVKMHSKVSMRVVGF